MKRYSSASQQCADLMAYGNVRRTYPASLEAHDYVVPRDYQADS
jgi:hypothetical protein